MLNYAYKLFDNVAEAIQTFYNTYNIGKHALGGRVFAPNATSPDPYSWWEGARFTAPTPRTLFPLMPFEPCYLLLNYPLTFTYPPMPLFVDLIASCPRFQYSLTSSGSSFAKYIVSDNLCFKTREHSI